MRLIPMEFKPSSIHGTGAFASDDIQAGEQFNVMDYVIQHGYTFRGFNHSRNPNIGNLHKFEDRGGSISGVPDLYATRTIHKGEELTVDYDFQPWESKPDWY